MHRYVPFVPFIAIFLQDAEVGDGTTSVVLLAAEILKECKEFIEDGLHPRIIIRGIREVIFRLKSGTVNNMLIHCPSRHATLL